MSILINFKDSFIEIWQTLFTVKSKSEFRANALKLLKATMAGQVIAVLTAPIISRIYTPDSIGLLTLFISLSSIFTVIMSFRYELAIVLPKRDDEAINILALSILIITSITCISIFAVFLLKEQIGAALNAPEIINWLILLPLSLFANGVYNAFSYWSIRRKRFGSVAIARISQSSITVLYKIIYGIMVAAKAGALIIGQVIGQIISSLVLVFVFLKEDYKQFVDKIKWQGIRKSAKEHINFPLYSSWSAILNVLSLQMPAILLALFFTSKIVGFYALGFRMLSTPLIFINQSVSQVFYQKISEIKNSGGSVKNIYWKMLIALIVASIFPTIGLALFGKKIFVIILGEAWAKGGLYVQILSPVLFFRFITTPISTVLLVYNKQKYDFMFNLVMLVLIVISISIGGFFGNPTISIAAMSFSLSISYLLLLFMQITSIKF